MLDKRWIGASLLVAMLLITGCDTTSQKEAPTSPAATDVQQEVEAIFEIGEGMEQEDIHVEVNQITMMRNADFGEGRTSDALVVTLSVENTNAMGLQLHPDSGKILLPTGEELLSAKGEYQETYPNGTVKKGDFYFPLQLTKLNEINGLTLVLEGPANQYYEPVGEEYVFDVEIMHPSYQEVDRESILQRVYDQSAALSQASGVADTFHVGEQVEMGPVTVHLMDVMIYENMQHPFADFLNLEEPVHFIGISLAVENNSEDMVYFSNARNKLLLGDTVIKDMDHLMSRYMGQAFHGGAIKTGTAFFRVEAEELEGLSPMSLLMESPWELEGEEKRLLSENRRVKLGGGE